MLVEVVEAQMLLVSTEPVDLVVVVLVQLVQQLRWPWAVMEQLEQVVEAVVLGIVPMLIKVDQVVPVS
jgi:hypothetical protein